VTGVHDMAYPLGAFFNIPHGLANAVLLPYVLEFNRIGHPERFARLGALLSGSGPSASPEQGAKECIRRIIRLSRAIGIPKNLAELKIPRKAIPEMAPAALKVARPIENNPRPISEEDIIALYEKMY
jgi:alcohol dehydrogenase